ncbi:MAG: MBL fold metallo-hydrolase [Anaerolineaceae bacterium]|nr:MBL fold metallo-hydrolase [Anaerolineaceae bacterium]
MAPAKPLSRGGRLLDINWYGQDCFRFSGRGQIAVVTDPCAPVKKKGRGLKADVVCLIQGEPGTVQTQLSLEDEERAPLLFWRPGEYEVAGIFMRGIPTHAASNGATRHHLAWLFHFGDLNLLHAGAMRELPAQDALESLGEVQVLLLPLGAGRLAPEDAAGLVTMLEPRSVVPVFQGAPQDAAAALAAFTGALGVSEPQEEEVLRVTAGNLPQQTRVVLLQSRPLPE